MNIQTSHLSHRSAAVIAVLLLSIFVFGASVSAQSNLQNTSTGVQSQTGQTQNSVNTQNQTGGVQNNNGQSVLNQNGVRPLGVVSNPRQTTPDAVATPSSTLKTDITRPNKPSKIPLLFALLSLIFLGAAYLFRRANRPARVVKPLGEAPTPYVRPEPMPAASLKKKKQPRKKRRNTTR